MIKKGALVDKTENEVSVPRMLRSSHQRVFNALWRCAADPGSGLAR